MENTSFWNIKINKNNNINKRNNTNSQFENLYE